MSNDASVKSIEFDIPYKSSTIFTLGIPIAGVHIENISTEYRDFVEVWIRNGSYRVAMIGLDISNNTILYSENTKALIWYI